MNLYETQKQEAYAVEQARRFSGTVGYATAPDYLVPAEVAQEATVQQVLNEAFANMQELSSTLDRMSTSVFGPRPVGINEGNQASPQQPNLRQTVQMLERFSRGLLEDARRINNAL